jgi:hypothetical protein
MSELTSLWHYLYASPNFVPSVVGVAAAFAGSWGAQVAIIRREQRRDVIATLNSVNEGVAICFTIANTFMALKRQHLVDMLARYRDLEERFETFKAERAKKVSKEERPVFAYEADLLMLPTIQVPIDRLEKSVFDKIALGTKPLALMIELIKSFNLANAAISSRNELIGSWYAGPPLVPDQFIVKYLGLKSESGVDGSYRTTLYGIESYTDDCIYHAKTLSEWLTEYGKKVRRNYRHHIFWRLPKVAETDFSSQEAKSMLPDPKDYEQWMSAFRSSPTRLEWIKSFFSGRKA